MLVEKYDNTPVYGFVPREKTRFCDKDLFGDDLWKYVCLRKIKLWYGTPKSGDENVKDKSVLGIQCVYQDIVSGQKTTTEQHCGDINGDDVEVKELELKENDFFTKFNIDFETTVTHLKFTTKNGEIIEVGKEKEETKKTVEFNDVKDTMIHSFVGYYNTYGLRALGCKFILKKDFILINLMGILFLSVLILTKVFLFPLNLSGFLKLVNHLNQLFISFNKVLFPIFYITISFLYK